jgi:hypothetical protein
LERRAKEVAKEYHDAIRRQKKAHWDYFLAEDVNIWKAAKYLKPDKTESKTEQAEELLSTFFPPLPARIDDEGGEKFT